MEAAEIGPEVEGKYLVRLLGFWRKGEHDIVI